MASRVIYSTHESSEELKALAQAKNITLPAALSDKHQKKYTYTFFLKEWNGLNHETSISIIRSPVFLRRNAYMLLEYSRKVLGVFKSKSIGNFT